MTDDSQSADPKTAKTDTALRVALLGVLYAAAVGFAVAFSPSFGVISLHSTGQSGSVAAIIPARN